MRKQYVASSHRAGVTEVESVFAWRMGAGILKLRIGMVDVGGFWGDLKVPRRRQAGGDDNTEGDRLFRLITG